MKICGCTDEEVCAICEGWDDLEVATAAEDYLRDNRPGEQ